MAKRMAKQMELFEPVERGFDEGGLMDEGGTVDPVSGNDVPPGSTKEEVRDDIPAQLSEGEFVFPADVVRYIGLENLMRMRQEAKQGLAQMEAMGQMGNSEEATMPDDLPFDMYDLDVEDDNNLKMQVGGFVNPQTGTYTVPGTGITGFQQTPGSTTGYNPNQPIQPYFQPVQFTQAQYQDPLQVTNIPTFADTVGSGFGQYDEMKTYVNSAGQTMQIPFKDGKPIYPIPEGYSEQGEKVEETVTTTPVQQKVQTAKVVDDGGKDPDEGKGSASGILSLGGKAVGKPIGGGIPFTRYAGPSRQVVDNTLFEVSFEIPGFTPNPLSMAGFMRDMVSKDGPGLPSDAHAIIGVKGGTVTAHKVRVPAIDYNIIRKDITGNLADTYRAAGELAEALENGSVTYDGSKQSFVDNDGNKISDDLAKGLDKLGESIYADVRDDTDRGDSMIEAGQNLSDSEKSALSAYNDKQFSDFFADEEKDSTPTAADAAGAIGYEGNQYSDDDSSPSDSGLGPSSDTDRGDTGRNTAR